MKFRLTYEGQLKASGNHNKHVEEKWDIRRALEPQLVELWKTHPALSGVGLYLRPPPLPSPVTGPQLLDYVQAEQSIHAESRADIAQKLQSPIVVGGMQFLPLVRKDLDLACKLDVTFLRKGQPGALILPGGDLDNRMKTLFDALSVPNEQDLRGNPDHEPFLCLLENDSLITDQHVETDRLLTKPDASQSEVHLVIHVSVNVMRLSQSNIGFLGD
jgi:hypothetical protein